MLGTTFGLYSIQNYTRYIQNLNPIKGVTHANLQMIESIDTNLQQLF